MADTNDTSGTEQVAFMDDVAAALDRMTLVERLRNPAWAEAEPNELCLETQPTRRDMEAAANIVAAAEEFADYFRQLKGR